jgi:hypothetical protein
MRTLVRRYTELRALRKLWKERVTKEDTLDFSGRLRRWLELSAGSRLLNWIEYDKQLRLYSWQPWWIIIALVKRQQRQSYVVQARTTVLAYEKSIPLQNNYMLTFTFVKRLLSRRKEPSFFVHAGYTNMNGVTYEFFQSYFIGTEPYGKLHCL